MEEEAEQALCDFEDWVYNGLRLPAICLDENVEEGEQK